MDFLWEARGDLSSASNVQAAGVRAPRSSPVRRFEDDLPGERDLTVRSRALNPELSASDESSEVRLLRLGDGRCPEWRALYAEPSGD